MKNNDNIELQAQMKIRTLEKELLAEVKNSATSAEGKAACARILVKLWDDHPFLFSGDCE